ncbi:MAG: phenylacetate--CoA ligase family protein [Xanthomonadales bacterium]|nr:phenylacetate--CoA ligase family protein [Xanthomonadales bacterium]
MSNPLELEREAQRQWIAQHPTVEPMARKLLEREFLLPGAALDLEARELARILNFSRSEVSWYAQQEAFLALPAGQSSVGREALVDLPVLSKFDVQAHFDDLIPRRVPRGHEAVTIASSSGTTGKPTRVAFSLPAAGMFGFHLQRQMRWFRVDPSWKKAIIRLPHNFPATDKGKHLDLGQVFRADGWPNVTRLFRTGPAVGFSRFNPTEDKLKWLEQEKPDYLMSFPGTLESLVLATGGKPVASLKAARTISATLTPGMRRRIETASGIHPQQNYGLNEIGIVALRCPEGRYHVNSEHCIVEILDREHRPCAAGEQGQIVVTALTNFAMPLIRYDTGDIGIATSGACPCGRTTPGFADVVGRYRPMHLAPEGTAQRVQLITDVIDEMDPKSLSDLREYQIHQYRDGRFELRLVSKGDCTELKNRVRAAWDATIGDKTPLKIVDLERIPPAPSGKQQEFSSDFFPSRDA